jgi:hypothetical protein
VATQFVSGASGCRRNEAMHELLECGDTTGTVTAVELSNVRRTISTCSRDVA